jgi:CheY-like chemotaxis protein
MGDDLVALRILIVSDAAAERDALRSAASQASVMIDVAEVDRIADATPTCKRLANDEVDVIFLDSRMSHDGRQAVIDAARSAEARPLVISVGAADLKNQALSDGIAVDGLLAKPIQPADARALLDACVRARLPNRVLVVDDSATVRSVIRKVLQSCRYNFEAEEAADGEAALEQAGKQRFDLVLLDCNMPGLDGFATLARFLQRHADTKVVMVTATNDTKIADRARAAGAHDVLYKPFYAKDVDVLMNRLHGLMRPKAS